MGATEVLPHVWIFSLIKECLLYRFGFARYFAKECAEAAKEKLHETELQDFGVKVSFSLI